MVTSKKSRISWFIARIIVYTAMIICLIPLIWMLVGAFKHNMDVVDPEKLFTLDLTIENFVFVFQAGGIWNPLKNSLLLTGSSLAFSMLFGVPAAYAFSQSKLRNLSSVVLIVRMIPAMTYLLPWFIMFRSMGISKTYESMIIAYTVSSLPLIVWVIMPYFDAIPTELTDAARIDGASDFQIFVRVMLPLSRPCLMTTAIMTVIGIWNDFLYVMVLGGASQRTLPMALMNYIGESAMQWGKLLASATVITIPLIIITVLMQKYIVSGMTAGAVKG